MRRRKRSRACPGRCATRWSSLDLEPFGFERRDTEPWFFRPAGPLEPEPTPPELQIVRATTAAEVAEFEGVSVRGFETEETAIAVGAAHPATILRERRMTNWIGRVAGRPVAAAMSYGTDAAIGVFGVTTIASARRRGYATAMTRAALLADTGLPSVLAPSPEGEGLYRRLGFRPVGELRMWWRDSPGT